jgi:hypothetical protein
MSRNTTQIRAAVVREKAGRGSSDRVRGIRRAGIHQHRGPGGARFAALFGHQPRTCGSFAEESAKEWAEA